MKRFKQLISYSFLMIIIYIIGGCGIGTTHHFLPHRPLKKKEVMLSFVWHYDFNNWYIPDLWPGGNFYIGTGNDWNIGIGYQLLFSITHFSFAKYYRQDPKSNFVLYGHINQLIEYNYNNPYIEVGGGYSRLDSKFSQTISGGLSFGNGVIYSIFPTMPRELDERKHMSEFAHKYRLMPFLRYVGGGRDLGVSLNYYFGHSKIIYDNMKYGVTHYNDIICHLSKDDIIGIKDNEILLKSGHINFYSPFYEFIDPDDKTTWAPLIKAVAGEYCKFYLDGKRILTNYQEIETAVKSGQDVIIRKYPFDVVDELNKVKGFDLSIGFSFIKYNASNSED